MDLNSWQQLQNKKLRYPLLTADQYLSQKEKSKILNFVRLDISSLNEGLISKIKNDSTVVIVLETTNEHGMAEQRRVFFDLLINEIKNPVIIKRDYLNLAQDELRLYSATDFGSLLIDGFGDGV